MNDEASNEFELVTVKVLTPATTDKNPGLEREPVYETNIKDDGEHTTSVTVTVPELNVALLTLSVDKNNLGVTIKFDTARPLVIRIKLPIPPIESMRVIKTGLLNTARESIVNVSILELIESHLTLSDVNIPLIAIPSLTELREKHCDNAIYHYTIFNSAELEGRCSCLGSHNYYQ